MADIVSDRDIALKRKIFNLALNDDFQNLTHLISGYQGSMNFLGACGEAPLHISIFKKNLKLLELILSKGADPNFMNSQGDNALHMVCRIGWLQGVEAIYASGRCSIKAPNRLNMSAVAICAARPSLQDIALLQLYSTWGSDQDIDSEVDKINEGRKMISTFLINKLLAEDQYQRMFLLTSTIEHNSRTFKETNIVRGGPAYIGTLQHWGPSFPEGHIPLSWTLEDRILMAGDPKGLGLTVRKDFVERYATQSILKAVHNLSEKQNPEVSHNTENRNGSNVNISNNELSTVHHLAGVESTALLGRATVLYRHNAGDGSSSDMEIK